MRVLERSVIADWPKIRIFWLESPRGILVVIVTQSKVRYDPVARASILHDIGNVGSNVRNGDKTKIQSE